jgi:glycosyltransferase involved in cell wall biosynthesis
MKVSIIIPVYNVEKYLRHCLDSVVNQTLKDIEIICVNDCSPDNSYLILEEYAKKDNRIKIITLKENGGLGNARNVALKEITSEYVMFLDSDDWLELNACELAYNQISKNKNDFVVFGFYNYKSNTSRVKNNVAKLYLEIKGKSSVVPTELDFPYFKNAQCWYKIFNTNFIIDNNILFDKGAFEDNIFNAKVFTLAKSISFLDKFLYNYRTNVASLSQNSLNYKDHIGAKLRSYNVVKNIGNQHVINLFLVYLISTCLHFFDRFSYDKNIRDDFYKRTHNLFVDISKENDISEIKNYIDYERFLLFKNNDNFKKYAFNKFIKLQIFSIRRVEEHKVITVLGLQFKQRIHRDLSDINFDKLKEKYTEQISEKENVNDIFRVTNNRTDGLLENLLDLKEFMFVPNKGNCGDIVIATSCYQYFDSNNLNYKVIDMTSHKSRKIRKPFNLVYGGGGLFTKYYQQSYQIILKIFKSKHLKKAVILPASFYDCEDVLDVLDEKFIVYCREKQSYEYCIKNNKKAKFILADDMAFGLNIDFYKSDIKYNLKNITNVLKDKNKNLIKELKYDLYPYFSATETMINNILENNKSNMGYFLRTDIETANVIEHKEQSFDISLIANSYCADKSFSIMLVKQFLRALDNYTTIVTDRLHVGICSALLGKNVYLIDNSYKKVSNVYEKSMKNMQNVKIITDINELKNIDTLTKDKSNNRSTNFVDFLAEWSSYNNNFGTEKRFWRK